jgi:hypothetical protein
MFNAALESWQCCGLSGAPLRKIERAARSRKLHKQVGCFLCDQIGKRLIIFGMECALSRYETLWHSRIDLKRATFLRVV